MSKMTYAACALGLIVVGCAANYKPIVSSIYDGAYVVASMFGLI
jgi:hypothetical protein